MDYISSGTRQFTFTPENFAYCFNVTVRDDSILEMTEAFSLKLTSEDEDVKFKTNELQLRIVDNDGKTCGLGN